MAKHKVPKPVPKSPPKARYPNGWPGNVRAVLYLNSSARAARIKAQEE